MIYRYLIKNNRQDAVETSRAVIKGQISEHILPLSEDWPWKLADARFAGNPVDYIVYNGYSESNITEIIFLEVKNNTSTLSQRQKQIKNCIENGRVLWQTYNTKN